MDSRRYLTGNKKTALTYSCSQTSLVPLFKVSLKFGHCTDGLFFEGGCSTALLNSLDIGSVKFNQAEILGWKH